MTGKPHYEDPPEHRVNAVTQSAIRPSSNGERYFIGGIPASEWNRLRALPTRPLVASDIPALPWKSHYANYRLREEDKAIVADGCTVELGFLDGAGGVNWTRA